MNRLLPWNFNLFPKQKLLILRSLGFNLPLIPNMSDVENCQLPWKCKWKIRNSVKHQAFVYKLSSRSESKGFRCVEIWPDQTKARPCSQIHKGVHMEFFFFFFFHSEPICHSLSLVHTTETENCKYTSIQIWGYVNLCMHILGDTYILETTNNPHMPWHVRIKKKNKQSQLRKQPNLRGLHKSMSGIITYLLMKNQSNIFETKNQNHITNILKIWILFTE